MLVSGFTGAPLGLLSAAASVARQASKCARSWSAEVLHDAQQEAAGTGGKFEQDHSIKLAFSEQDAAFGSAGASRDMQGEAV